MFFKICYIRYPGSKKPQKSTLVPVLFLLNINDTVDISSTPNISYADDTSILMLIIINKKYHSSLRAEDFNERFCSNKLFRNTDSSWSVKIEIFSAYIEISGMHTDESLNWKHLCEGLETFNKYFLIRNLRSILSTQQLLCMGHMGAISFEKYLFNPEKQLIHYRKLKILTLLSLYVFSKVYIHDISNEFNKVFNSLECSYHIRKL